MRHKPQVVKTGREPNWLVGVSYGNVSASMTVGGRSFPLPKIRGPVWYAPGREDQSTFVSIEVFLTQHPVPPEFRTYGRKGKLIGYPHKGDIWASEENPRLTYALAEIEGKDWTYLIHEKDPRVVHGAGWVKGRIKPTLGYLESVIARFTEVTRRWDACEELMCQRKLMEQAFRSFRGRTKAKIWDYFKPPKGCLIEGGKGKRQVIQIDVCQVEGSGGGWWYPRFIVAVQPKASEDGLDFDVIRCGEPDKRIGGGTAANIENVLRESEAILRANEAPVRERVVRVSYE